MGGGLGDLLEVELLGSRIVGVSGTKLGTSGVRLWENSMRGSRLGYVGSGEFGDQSWRCLGPSWERVCMI